MNTRPTKPLAGQRTGLATQPDTRVVGVSRRIWIALAALIFVIGFTGFGMMRANNELDEARAALREARSQAKENSLALKHALAEKEQALADKQHLVKELAAQGNRLAEFSRGEEKAKSKLELSAEQADRQLADLKARLAQAERNVTALTAELEMARDEMENARAEMERLRAALEPYSNRPAPPGVRGQ